MSAEGGGGEGGSGGDGGEVGMRVEEVETPVMVVDLDLVEENCKKAVEMVGDGVEIRPHFKAHKCVGLAKVQMEVGGEKTRGFCAQKVNEAVALFRSGILDVRLVNEVVDERKMRRVVEVCAEVRGKLAVTVDDEGNVGVWDKVARDVGVRVGVCVEVDAGQGRCGVDGAEEALELAKVVQGMESLDFEGIQVYQGSAQHVRGAEDRKKEAERVRELAKSVKEVLEKEGLVCGVVTGGGTGTLAVDGVGGVFTEVQPGSYVGMDADYAANETSSTASIPFKHALSLRATVMSRNAPKCRAVLDVGLKGISGESGPPTLPLPHVTSVALSDEHTQITFSDPSHVPPLASSLPLTPPHIDPAMNLHPRLLAARKGVVVAVWEVERNPGL